MDLRRGAQCAGHLEGQPAGAPASRAHPRAPRAGRVPEDRIGGRVTAPALTCREVIDLRTDYVEDALAAEERGRVEAHLATCDGCTTYLEQVRETIRLTGMLTEEQIPDEEKQRLLAAFRDWTRPGSPPG